MSSRDPELFGLVNISITFDVEVWCGGWRDLDSSFPGSFQRYVYGDGPAGYALPKTLEWMNEFGLQGVFFLEPLFSYRFGIEPLKEIVELILGAGQEVQLHLHPEWSDEASPALVARGSAKRPYMYQYPFEQQVELIARGIEALLLCGVPRPTAFRAGSYACNRDTYRALAANQIWVDSSLNTAYPGSGEDLRRAERSNVPGLIEGVKQVPVTVFRDGLGKMRHWQVGAAGFAESVHLIQQAAHKGYTHLVLVSHNFEMLVPGKSKTDPIVARRFRKLCSWLADHADRFPTTSLTAQLPAAKCVPGELKLPLSATVPRLSAQIARRLLEKL